MSLIIHNNLKAISYMLLHALSTASLFALIKMLTKDISPVNIVFFYKSLSLILSSPWIISGGLLNNLKTKKIKSYIFGGILGTGATLCLMHGIKYVPLADATILGYLEKILLFIIGILYFKEKTDKKKSLAIIFSFIGALIVTLPTMNHSISFNLYYLFILASIILWVGYCLVIKSLGKTEDIKTQFFYTALLSTIFSAPIALIAWNNPSFLGIMPTPMEITSWQELGLEFKHLPMLILITICYLIISISLFKSMQCGNLSIIMPFGYTKIIFAGLFGAILFKEYPSINHYIGYFLIIASSCYLAHFKKTI